MPTTNAFISYSHQDAQMLDMLHKHLSQLQRDQIISAWTDREIPAGGELDKDISTSLAKSRLFLALLSPDYIASRYCYEREFETALSMQEQGKIVIVPIIIEPCDWQSTPFGKFKALPQDGKAVSIWQNRNTAFLDVIQNLRKLVNSSNDNVEATEQLRPSTSSLTRNYRVQKDFDSIQRMEFIEKAFQDVRDYLKRYMEEITQIDNVKSRIVNESADSFECLLVNRNKIATEARLKISVMLDVQNNGYSRMNNAEMVYSISSQNSRGGEKGFNLMQDDFHLFWTQGAFYSSSQGKKEFELKDMADLIWNEWLETVGIM